MAKKNRIEKLEKQIDPIKQDDSPVVVHADGLTRLMTAKERKKIKGDSIRVIVNDKINKGIKAI